MQALKTLRNIVLWVFILGLLFAGAGVAYVRLIDRHEPAPSAPAEAKVTTPAVFRKPPKPPADAVVGAAVQSVLSPVAAGANSSITVATTPGAKCTIEVKYNNVASTDSGLAPKTADDYGRVTWSWTVEKTAPAGKWPIEVLCSRNKHSGMVRSVIEVT